MIASNQTEILTGYSVQVSSVTAVVGLSFELPDVLIDKELL